MREINDPDVQILRSLSQTLQSTNGSRPNAWEGSPFEWIKNKPSPSERGKIGARLVSCWLERKGFKVHTSPDSDADCVINGYRAEVKFSTLWQSGVFKFQQLRDQDYSFVVCFGITPFDAMCWIIPKDLIMQQWIVGNELKTQHLGESGSDTAWLSFKPNRVPAWLSEWGGRMDAAVNALAKITGRNPLP